MNTAALAFRAAAPLETREITGLTRIDLFFQAPFPGTLQFNTVAGTLRQYKSSLFRWSTTLIENILTGGEHFSNDPMK